MAITITSEDERESLQLGLDLPRDAKGLVLVDSEGTEYHFGCGTWTSIGTFVHAATYTTEGRRPYAWWADVLDGMDLGMDVRNTPELGPDVTPLVEIALEGLASACNFHNGFYGEPEKRWAVDVLRALWEEAEEPLDPDEIAVWIATHGWAPKHAKTVREMTEGVRNGKRFMGAGHAINRDRERERKMVAYWREKLAERT